MRYLPPLHRYRRRPPKLRLHFLSSSQPGQFGVDLGEAATQLDWAELLRDAGLKGRI